MLNEFVRNHVKAIVITTIVLFVTIVGVAIFITIDRSGKVEVTVSVVPNDAKTTINGQTVTSSGTIYLKPDTYDIASSKEGFSKSTKKQYIGENQSTITVSLEPQSADAQKWAEAHANDYLKNEGIAGEAVQKSSEAARDATPILNVLPYSNLIYTIGYMNDPDDPSSESIILTIDAAEGSRNAAIDQIRELGYDPTDYKIKFNDYKNPFES